jgi:hypothetical protein
MIWGSGGNLRNKAKVADTCSFRTASAGSHWQIKPGRRHAISVAGGRSKLSAIEESFTAGLSCHSCLARFGRKNDRLLKFGEGYGVYVGMLSDVVQSIAEKEPDRSDVW